MDVSSYTVTGEEKKCKSTTFFHQLFYEFPVLFWHDNSACYFEPIRIKNRLLFPEKKNRRLQLGLLTAIFVLVKVTVDGGNRCNISPN